MVGMTRGSGRCIRISSLLVLVLIGGCGPLVLSVDDTVVMDSQPALLVAHVERQHVLGLRTRIEDVPVRFFLNGKTVGENIAGEGGRAAVTADVPPDHPETFHVQTAAKGRMLEATGRVFYWHKGRVIIAVDIDHTISKTDYDKLLMTNLPQTSPPIPGARDTLAEMSKDYYIVYVTARPRFLLEKTRDWLTAYDFPSGPVVTAPRLSDAIQPAKWKSRILEKLRYNWPDLLIGIGNHNTDAESYAPNNMLPVIIYTTGEELHYADEVVLADWNNVGKFFATNRATLTDPQRLREVIAGEGWLEQPIIPWHDPKRSVKMKVQTGNVVDRLRGGP